MPLKTWRMTSIWLPCDAVQQPFKKRKKKIKALDVGGGNSHWEFGSALICMTLNKAVTPVVVFVICS